IVASRRVGQLSLLQSALPRALSLLERAMDLCRDADLPFYFSTVVAPLGAAYALSGRVADAVALLTRVLEPGTAMERLATEAPYSLSLSEAQMLAGRLAEAHALAERALAHAREHQERSKQAYALRLLGDIAAHQEP